MPVVDSVAAGAHSMAMDAADLRDIQAGEAPNRDLRDLEAALAGDGDAYGRLVRRHQKEIAKRMWRFTRDRRQLEELVHDVFVEAYFSLRSFRGRAPFVHWLNRIATRVGYRFWKSQKRAAQEVPLQDWDGIVDPQEDAMSAQEAGEVLHRCLAQLPPRDRLVLTLLYLEELSVAEAAERAGWSRTMVKVQAHRARRKLRVLLEEAEELR